MKFLLTALKLFYVLDLNWMPFPTVSDEDTDEIKAHRKKQEEDELICRGHILNTLSDRFYDLYTSMKSPKEIWNDLEAKYKTEKVYMNKFIIPLIIKCFIISQFWIKCLNYRYWSINSVICQSIFLNHSKWVHSL